MSKVRSTVVRVSTIYQSDQEIGVNWMNGPTIALNPSHVVSQVPFKWSNADCDQKYVTHNHGAIHGLCVRTVLGETFYLDATFYL